MAKQKADSGGPGETGPSTSTGSIAFATVSILTALFACACYPYRGFVFQPRELLPLSAAKLTSLPELADAEYTDKMLWGSYRPGLYFGMRTRTPTSLLSGLMWFDPDSVDTLYEHKVRHAANDGDALKNYGWVRHDGSTFGRQVFVDEDYNLSLAMVKSFGPDSGTGGDWAVRITANRAQLSSAEEQRLEMKARQSGNKRPKGGRQRISLVMYLGDEGVPSDNWQVMPEGEPEELVTEPITLATGGNSHLGAWSFHVSEDNSSHAKSKNSVSSRLDYLAQPYETTHNYLVHVKEFMLSIMYDNLEKNPSSGDFRLYLPNGVTTGSNLALFQVTISLPGTVDFVFLSHPKGGSDSSISNADRVTALSGSALTAILNEREQNFEDRFEESFPVAASPPPPPEDEDQSAGAVDPAASAEVAKVALSSLLGSMGYYYGSSRIRVSDPQAGSAFIHAENWWSKLQAPKQAPVDEEDDPEPPLHKLASLDIRPYPAAPLFTGVPSRGGAPHGSLWDEGFHQLLLQRWDSRMSRDVIAHWLDLINMNGWIPRHQFLGYESTNRVSEDESVQDPNAAHPPTLLLSVLNMAQQLKKCKLEGADASKALCPASAGSTDKQAMFLKVAWPRLEAWYGWYNRSFAGLLPGSFRWKGRHVYTNMELNPKTPSSGMSDYPRASHLSVEERHLDLRCWMAVAAEAMTSVAEALGLPQEKIAPYWEDMSSLGNLENLDALHLDAESGQYRDWGSHTEEVKLTMRSIRVKGQRMEASLRVVTGTPSPQLVPHFGYVSLFPLMMRLLPPDSVQLGRQLEMLGHADLLWSSFGLRSLATNSTMYMAHNSDVEPPGWRGHIALNMNYLVLKALQHYRDAPGPHADLAASLYTRLREALLRTVVNGHQHHGSLCELYDDKHGKCFGSHPFTGWTALITLVAQQP